MARGALLRDFGLGLAEGSAAIAAATGAVALLDGIAPAAGLGVVYLPAVLLVAYRRGEPAALATAIVSVLALNFFFIAPRHRLTIADSHNVAALAVFLIAGVVVSRLASASRQRARESEERARIAADRERESSLLLQVASSLLAEGAVGTQLEAAGSRLTEAVAGSGLRAELAHAPSPRAGETVTPLPLRERRAWLYSSNEAGWAKGDLERIAEPLARLVDVALERELIGERTAEAEAARRADVIKTALLHAVSHDLRSPLTAITTAAGALRSGPLSSGDEEELVSVIGVESARLTGLVENLLDLSRIEAGAVDPRPDWCDLLDAVGRAAEQVRAEHSGAEIRLELPAELPLVRADAAQLERVFSNLVENGVKFSPPGEVVRVSAAVALEQVTVRVEDRGRGIPQGARARVFEPFFRSGTGPGSGLGLTICRGFVEANGGQIRLQARRGGGSSFSVSFPLVTQPTAPA